MSFEFLHPISEDILAEVENLHKSTLGKQLSFHTANDFPDLTEIKVAIIGVVESRRSVRENDTPFNFNHIRKEFYKLYSGNWNERIADLGDIYGRLCR